MRHRRTIAREIAVSGIGLHSGLPSAVVLQPGPPGEGLLARVDGGLFQQVTSLRALATERCTRIEFADGRTVDTVEHLLAALAIGGISDIRITFDCVEAPILDGSSMPWIAAIAEAGHADLPLAAETYVVTRAFDFSIGGSHYSVVPGNLSFHVSIDFPNTRIGRQSVVVGGDDIVALADSRTFVLEHEIAALQAAGLALGGGLHNAVVIGSAGPLNAEGFRHPDECVRHKALDLIGDLFLAGCLIIGAFSAHRPGHAANSAFLQAMLREGVLARNDPFQVLAA